MSSRLKVAVVGCGGAGKHHQIGYLQHPKAELVAVVDVDEAKARARAKELGIAQWYASVRELLANEACDAVDVVTPAHLHFQPVMECLEAGKHVLCEKPLSFSIHEAEAMVAKAAEKGLHLAVNYNRRFAPGYVRARQWFDAGSCGRVAYIDMKLSQGGQASSGRGPYDPLYEVHTHAIDLIRWFGGEIVAVCAQMARPRLQEAKLGEEACWTSMAISMRLENDAVASLLAGCDSDFVHPIERFEICGAEGQIVVDNVISRATLMRHDDPVVSEYRPSIFRADPLTFDRTFALRVGAFVDDLLNGRPPVPAGSDGLQALRVVAAIVRSWEEKREVSVSHEG